jgi:hypothetical protein
MLGTLGIPGVAGATGALALGTPRRATALALGVHEGRGGTHGARSGGTVDITFS